MYYLCNKFTNSKIINMKTTNEKQQTQEFDPETMFITSTGEIKRLSKYEIWRRANPGGWFTVVDWRAVNK